MKQNCNQEKGWYPTLSLVVLCHDEEILHLYVLVYCIITCIVKTADQILILKG